MNEAIRRTVRKRADERCEFCQLSQAQSPFAKLQIDHIRPMQHGGADDLNNLALACIDCNLHKGPNLAGIDPETNQMVPLFNPRMDLWDVHFRWNALLIEGLTPKGRVTVEVLAMNSEERLEVRLAWL